MSKNVKLECYSSEKLGKKGFLIEKEGRVVHSDVSKMSDDYKRGIFLSLYDGILVVRGMVDHDSMLTIVLQNRNVAEWVLNRDEYKCSKYSDVSDKVFDLIDELDCKYRIVSMKSYGAQRMVKTEPVRGLETSGIESVLDFE